MNTKQRSMAFIEGLMVLAGVSLTSCIREELPSINVDVTNISPVKVEGSGIVKTTIQENGVTVYASSEADLKNLQLSVATSKGAKASFVDVEFDSLKYEYPEGSGNYIFVPGQCPVFTNVKGEIAQPSDFTVTRYVKVVSEAAGLNEDDKTTQQLIDAQQPCRECTFGQKECNHPNLMGWDKDGVLSRKYVNGAHLYKIWTVKVLPAGMPTKLTFDNWESRGSFQQPYEIIDGVQSNIWSSTNSSIALMAVNPLIQYGARPTEDAVSGKALQLTSNDIRFAGTPQKPYIAGCCFIGEFDGSDTGALTCTHVGLPFNQKPISLTFWYKFLPMEIKEPNPNMFGTSFVSMGEYAGKLDRGFIRAVLYRADGKTPWVDGESIRNASHEDVVAYAEFAPEGKVDQYTKQTVNFTYTQEVNEEDLKNWKYNLAIYMASSYEGFRFICGADMSRQMQGQALGEQMGTQLFIDEMEINCK